MRPLLTLALLLCTAVSALAAPVNPMDWVGPTTTPDGWYHRLSADGKTAVFVGLNSEISVMDLYKQQVIARFRAEASMDAIYSPNSGEGNPPPFDISDHGEWVAQANRSTVSLWYNRAHRPVTRISVKTVITSVMFVPNQASLIIATGDGQLYQHDCATGKLIRKKAIGKPIYQMTALRSINRWAGFVTAHSLAVVNPKDLSTRVCSIPAPADEASNAIENANNDMVGYYAPTKEIIAAMPCERLARWRLCDLKPQKSFALTDIKGVSPAGIVFREQWLDIPMRKDQEFGSTDQLTSKVTVQNNKLVSKPFNSKFEIGVGLVSFDGTGKVALGFGSNPSLVDFETGQSLISFKWQPVSMMHAQLVVRPPSFLPETNNDYPGVSLMPVVPNVFAVASSPRIGDDSPEHVALVGKYYITMKADKSPIKLYSLDTRQQIGVYPEFEVDWQLPHISLSNDAKYIASTVDGAPKIRALTDSQLIITPKMASKVHLVELSSDGRLYALAGYDTPGSSSEYGRNAALFIIDRPSAVVKSKLYPHQGDIVMAHFTKSSDRMVSLDSAATVRIWDTATGKVLHSIPQAGMNVLFFRDDRYLHVQVNSITYDLYDALSGRKIARTWRYWGFSGRDEFSITVSFDGRYDADSIAITQLMTLQEGHTGLIDKQGLKYTPYLWEALTK